MLTAMDFRLKLAVTIIVITLSAHIYFSGPPYTLTDMAGQAIYAFIVQLFCMTAGMAIGKFGPRGGRPYGALIGSFVGAFILLYFRLIGIFLPLHGPD